MWSIVHHIFVREGNIILSYIIDNHHIVKKFREKEPAMWAKLDKLKVTLDSLITGDKAPSKEQMRTVINETVFADVLKEQEEALAKAKAAEEEATRVTLNKYMDQFLQDIKAGVRLTEKGTVFTDGSIRTIRTSARPKPSSGPRTSRTSTSTKRRPAPKSVFPARRSCWPFWRNTTTRCRTLRTRPSIAWPAWTSSTS